MKIEIIIINIKCKYVTTLKCVKSRLMYMSLYMSLHTINCEIEINVHVTIVTAYDKLFLKIKKLRLIHMKKKLISKKISM